MKVAYLVTQYPTVSHSFIRREILALEDQGVEVLRIALRGWDGDLVDAEDLRERQRTRYVLQRGILALFPAVLRAAVRSPARFFGAVCLAMKMGRRADRPLPYHLVYLAEACWVVPLMQTERAEHLHAHFGTNSAEVAMLAHLLCGVPYSFTAHGTDEVDKNQYIGLAEKIRRSAFVVAVSSFGRSQLFRWVEHQEWRKINMVHCGLERAFHDIPAVPMPDRPRLVCVARLSKEKGHPVLVEAAAALARQGVNFELVLAGDGELRREIEAQIAKHALGQRIRITGWISGAQVRDEIQAAKALVLPSLAEGLPVVIMEAMALRRPILATYVGGIPELVIHGENGWLFPAGAVFELAAAMKACLATPCEVLIRMGNLARQRALERHDVVAQAKRLAELFHCQGTCARETGGADKRRPIRAADC